MRSRRKQLAIRGRRCEMEECPSAGIPRDILYVHLNPHHRPALEMAMLVDRSVALCFTVFQYEHRLVRPGSGRYEAPVRLLD